MAKFNRDEAEVICRIPLSRQVVEDSMVWLHNRRGEYTIRSGYHVAQQVLRTESWVEASNRSGWQHVWGALWKLKLPGLMILKLLQILSSLTYSPGLEFQEL